MEGTENMATVVTAIPEPLRALEPMQIERAVIEWETKWREVGLFDTDVTLFEVAVIDTLVYFTVSVDPVKYPTVETAQDKVDAFLRDMWMDVVIRDAPALRR